MALDIIQIARRIPILLALGTSILSPAAAAGTPTDNPQKSKLDQTVQGLALDYFKVTCHAGLSMGIYDKGNAAFYNYGTTSKEKPKLPTKKSIYEIASITKTFTGALAARALVDGRMTLDSDFRLYLKEPYPNLEIDGKPITLQTLAAHTSGLPKDIPNSDALFEQAFKDHDSEKLIRQLIAISKDYDEERYLRELHDVTLAAAPGASRKYSNIGIQLIGFGLENVYGQPYSRLLKHYITGPLGMTHTGLRVSGSDKHLLVQGYDQEKPAPYHLDSAGAAGGIYSSTEDMMRYIAWHLAESDPVVKRSHAAIDHEGDLSFGLIWNEVATTEGERVLQESGGSFGMSSQLFLFPEAKVGIVLLANDSCMGPDGSFERSTQPVLGEMAMAIHAAQGRN